MTFSPELASILNWRGSDKKKGVKGMKCSNVILGENLTLSLRIVTDVLVNFLYH